MTEEKGERTTGGLPKYGLTEVIFGFCNSIVLHIQLDIINLAFCCYLHLQFFNHHRFRAGRSMNSLPSQILNVSGKQVDSSKLMKLLNDY